MHVAIYTRLSDDRDGQTARQEADCRAHAERNGWTVVEVFTDDDRSAYRHGGRDRPAFNRMLGQLERFDAIVFWKVDRLVRRVVQFAKVLEAAEQADTRLVCVLEPLDTTTPMGKGIASMFAAMGEQESHNISVRVARANEQRALEGLPHPSGQRAFGYTDNWTGHIDKEADLVREAAARVLAGDTVSAIARDFNDRGITTTAGNLWRPFTIRRMLTGPHIAGLRVYDGEVVAEGVWEPIVGRDVHERLKAALAPRKRYPRRSYLLTGGLAVCGICGRRLYARPRASGKRAYACRNDPGHDGCGSISTVAGPFEEWVEGQVCAALAGDGLADMLAVQAEADDQASIVADLQAAEQRAEQLAADWGAGTLSRPEWVAARQAVEERAASLRRRLARTAELDTLTAAARLDLPNEWEDLELDVKAAIIGSVVDEVQVHRVPVPGRKWFDPDRVTVAWKV